MSTTLRPEAAIAILKENKGEVYASILEHWAGLQLDITLTVESKHLPFVTDNLADLMYIVVSALKWDHEEVINDLSALVTEFRSRWEANRNDA